MSFRCEKRSARQGATGRADLCQIVRRLRQEDQSVDAHAREGGAVLRLGTEPGGRKPGKDTEAESGRIAPCCLVLVARDACQLGELRMTRLGVEAVAMLAGDSGHARTEAADDDGWRRLGAQIAGGSVESIVAAREARRVSRPESAEDLRRLCDALGAYGIGLHREPEALLLSRVGSAAASSRAKAEDEAASRDLLERGSHVREETRMSIRYVQHERPQRDPSGRLGERGEGHHAFGHAHWIAIGIAQVIPGPHAIEARLVGRRGGRAHVRPASTHGDQEQVGLHRGSIAELSRGGPWTRPYAEFGTVVWARRLGSVWAPGNDSTVRRHGIIVRDAVVARRTTKRPAMMDGQGMGIAGCGA